MFFLFQRPGPFDADHDPGVDVEQGAARAGLTSTYWLGGGHALTPVASGKYVAVHILTYTSIKKWMPYVHVYFKNIQAYT